MNFFTICFKQYVLNITEINPNHQNITRTDNQVKIITHRHILFKMSNIDSLPISNGFLIQFVSLNKNKRLIEMLRIGFFCFIFRRYLKNVLKCFSPFSNSFIPFQHLQQKTPSLEIMRHTYLCFICMKKGWNVFRESIAYF